MSFSMKEVDFLEFDKEVLSMSEDLRKIPFDKLVDIHNELLQNSEDYRTIAGAGRIVVSDPEHILKAIPEDVLLVESMFDLSSVHGALLRGVVLYLGADALTLDTESDQKEPPRYVPIYKTGQKWFGVVHKLAVFFAIRGKTPQEMFGAKFFPELERKEADNAADQ